MKKATKAVRKAPHNSDPRQRPERKHVAHVQQKAPTGSQSEARPVEEHGVARAWNQLERALDKFKRPSDAKLAPGARNTALNGFEAMVGRALPPEVRSYFATHNGQTGKDFGLAAGFRFLSLSEAAKSAADWAEARRSLGTSIKSLDRTSRSHPPDAIQRKFSLSGWVALLSDWEGNHIGVDLEPGPAGAVGQIINFGRDEEDKYVLFPSVVELLEWFAAEYLAKRIVFDKIDEVVRHEEGRLTGVLIERVRASGAR